MNNTSSIELNNFWSWEAFYPLTEDRRTEIKSQYLALSPVMRSVAGQIAVQRHLEENNHPSMARFIESLDYDSMDTTQLKCPNFWYKLFAGRAMTQSNTIDLFFDGVNYPTASILMHPLWSLIDHRVPIESSLKQFAIQFGGKLFRKLCSWHCLDEIPLSALKQSYPSQRQKQFEARSFDSLNALIFITLNQIRECKHLRPTTAERYAYALFLFLFGYKYRTRKKLDMGIMLNELLTPSSSSGDRDRFEQRLSSDQGRIIEIGLSLPPTVSDEAESIVCTKTLHWILASNHPCFK
ncbi:hypothetical protein NJR55_01105 [Idiomarina sp. M1R2S28]|uniref:Uncharacterized protein n=1 Tax=Idiomarina rhizosphaerae TaxID=2961572 RepID=A0A9X2G1D4_9GAMM|nr:hypothetical protein [Idiomarina rhizosphaerae]MCP1338178.1 hypothetical protein [Idiomarina rhizosphaerae]